MIPETGRVQDRSDYRDPVGFFRPVFTGKGESMPISVEVCERCKRMFKYPGFGPVYCSDCLGLDVKKRERVKEYLRENGQANIYQISLATSVPERDIMYYLKEGMLEIPEGSPIYIKCERCGCDLRSGRWCLSCARKLVNGLKINYVWVGDEPKHKTVGKMRFLGQDFDKK